MRTSGGRGVCARSSSAVVKDGGTAHGPFPRPDRPIARALSDYAAARCIAGCGSLGRRGVPPRLRVVMVPVPESERPPVSPLIAAPARPRVSLCTLAVAVSLAQLWDTIPMETARARFETTLDLWATAVELRRQAFRREYPAASDDQIEHLVNQWLAHRPGAERGDGQQPLP
jgi:hypothetical protein